jgi:hypothetical protein
VGKIRNVPIDETRSFSQPIPQLALFDSFAANRDAKALAKNDAFLDASGIKQFLSFLGRILPP